MYWSFLAISAGASFQAFNAPFLTSARGFFNIHDTIAVPSAKPRTVFSTLNPNDLSGSLPSTPTNPSEPVRFFVKYLLNGCDDIPIITGIARPAATVADFLPLIPLRNFSKSLTISVLSWAALSRTVFLIA